MFGYILPRRDKLSQEQQDRYRAAYCGLCRSLKEEYGFRARFLVNYDMTFLYFLLQNGAPQQATKCFCPAHPFCKKACLPNDAVMTYAADMSVLLSYWKLCDAELDGRFFQKLGAKLLKRLYKKVYQKAADRLPQANAVFSEQLSALQALEQAQCASIDRTADAFAKMLSGCVCYLTQKENRRAFEQLLYHIGRFLYLADALEDLPKDLQADRYNPLRYRYELSENSLRPEDKAQLVQTVDASIDMAATAFELLPKSADAELLENVIYYGLPTVLKAVSDGTFRKRGKTK